MSSPAIGGGDDADAGRRWEYECSVADVCDAGDALRAGEELRAWPRWMMAPSAATTQSLPKIDTLSSLVLEYCSLMWVSNPVIQYRYFGRKKVRGR